MAISGSTDLATFPPMETSDVGLKGVGKITYVEITDTGWTKLPPNPLPGRKAVCIQNVSGQEIKINYDPTIPVYEGVTIFVNGDRTYNEQANLVQYARSKDSNCTVTVEELS